MSGDSDQARRLSELVDGLLLHRRYDDDQDGDVPIGDSEFRDLAELARVLSDVTLMPPDGFREELARRLPAMAEQEASAARNWAGVLHLRGLVRAFGRRFLQLRLPRLPAGPSAAVLALIVALVFRWGYDPSVVSASEILSRSDAAFSKLVGSGQVLYRSWKVTSTTTRPGSKDVTYGPVRIIREWMDGADFDRVAGRWYSADERLLIAYTSVGSGGERRPDAYFSPGVYGEVRGVLNIEPTVQEYESALRWFPEEQRRQLDVYLKRQYLYMPIIGERRFNHAIIESRHDEAQSLPRIVVSFDSSEIDSTPVYRVRVVDPASISFNWRSEGAPRVNLAWAQIVRYIARDSYLSVRSEETLKFVDGRERFTTRELIETRAISAADLTLDPFKIDVPQGTPIHEQSAYEQLAGAARAFKNLPELTAVLERPAPSGPR